MVVAVFSMTNQAIKIEFFEKTFLMTNISLNAVFEIFFFTLSDVNVDILKKKL